MSLHATRDKILAQSATSVGDMLRRRVRQTPDAAAFKQPTRRPQGDEVWIDLTWADTQAEVDVVAAGLLGLGLEPEQRVAIASSTRMEWILADLGIACAGGTTTTVYPNTTKDDVDYIVRDSETVLLFAENQSQLDKISDDLAGQIHHAVVFDDDRRDREAENVLSWDEFRELGRGHLAEHPDCVTDAIAATTREHLSTLIYTSGTTGQPKGVHLTHGNWTYQAAAMDTLDIVRPDDLQYLWLPLSHVFGKCLLAIQLQVGFCSAVDGRIDRIVAGLGETNPTFMCGAPRIFEKVRNAVMTSSPSNGVKGKVARWAFSVGRDSRDLRLQGRRLPPLLAAQYAVADKLVFSKLKNRMGGRIRFFISGSAKLSSQVQEWFYSAGITIVEGYGATETSAIAFVNHPSTPHFGTVGTATPGIDVQLASDGELLLRGPIITSGYHGAAAETAEALTGGWYHTGDIGELDPDGYLRITDRKKDLFKTSGGKYVAPQKVEGAIAANVPLVSQAIAVGDGRKFCAALLTLDPQALERWASQNGHEGTSVTDLVASPQVRDAVQQGIDAANSRLERWETVKRFAILPTEISVESGGVTPNMKVRRSVVHKHYQRQIDELYGPDDE